MRLKHRTEVTKAVDEIVAEINQRWRQPISEVLATFEGAWTRVKNVFSDATGWMKTAGLGLMRSLAAMASWPALSIRSRPPGMWPKNSAAS